MPVLKPAALIDNRVQAIRKYHAEAGIPRAELDLSGGIDSAVMAGLLVLALGPQNVTLAHLAINTNPEQTARARRLAAAIGCRLAVADFTDFYAAIVEEIRGSLQEAGYDGREILARIIADPTVLGSIRSTLRAPLGRAYNRLTGGGIRHGTGNECEDRFLRFYQKGGDGEVDCNAIAMLSKLEVYQLAHELGLSFEGRQGLTGAKAAYGETIGATPSADLWGNGDQHNDESEISKWLGAPFTYGKLDPKTGKVLRIGTIERIARFVDEPYFDGVSIGSILFHDMDLEGRQRTTFDKLLRLAATSKAFEDSGLSEPTIEALLRGARKAERQTRHKMNPNCPMLGSRQELLAAGILTDDFSAYEMQAAVAATV